MADFDGDGDPDLLGNGDRLLWYENENGTFTVHSIDTATWRWANIRVSDLDGDGDSDVIASQIVFTPVMSWWENDGSGSFQRHDLAHSGFDEFSALDVDRDGQVDLVGLRSLSVVWLRNLGQAAAFEEILVSDTESKSHDVKDFDADGDLDLLLASGHQVVMLEQVERGTFQSRDVAKGRYDFASGGDIDGDGDTDIVATGAETLHWFENRSGDFRDPVATAFDAAFTHELADVDGDGDLDLFLLPPYGRLSWRENRSAVSVSLTPERVDEDAGRPLTATLRRFGDNSAALSVSFVLDGTASVDDYVMTGPASLSAGLGTLAFPAGVEQAELTFTPRADAVPEDHESLRLSLVPGLDYGLHEAAAQATIHDDEPADFGDAPAPYARRSRTDAARHPAFGPWLGSARDAEADVQPNATATGDDVAGLADEDGVTFGTVRVGQLAATVTVRVGNAPNGARLEAWIDFDRDGSWSGPGERILDDAAVAEGDRTLTFAVPASAAAGETFARFRLSTLGRTGPHGPAADGEVEDLRVTILPASAAPGTFGGQRPMAEDARAPENVVAADVDLDGDLDFVKVHPYELAWLENRNRGEEFVEHVIDAFVNLGAVLVVADIDRDGDADFVTTNGWYENEDRGSAFRLHRVSALKAAMSLRAGDLDDDGDEDLLVADQFGPLDALLNDGQGRFVERRIAAFDRDGLHDLALADFTGDGQLDVIVALQQGPIELFENLGVGRSFARHVLIDESVPVRSLAVADFDRDGDLDLAGARFQGRVMWYENVGSRFSPHEIPVTTWGEVEFADLDADGDVDLLPQFGTPFSWWENRAAGTEFVAHDSVSRLGQASTALAADVDGDGDLDAVVVSSNGRLFWIEHDRIFVALRWEADDGHRVDEDEPGRMGVVVERRGEVGSTIAVVVQASGIATPGVDYRVSGATLTGDRIAVVLPAGFASQQFFLDPTNDLVAEVNESIVLSVLESGGYSLDVPSSVVATILDDEPADFGDAPVPYGQLRANDGARHVAVGPRLGVQRDEEIDTQPSDDATRDDANESAGDDGVTVGPLRAGQSGATATVRVEDAARTVFLSAWIDWNRDGTWDSATERIVADRPVTDGEHVFRFNVPAQAGSGVTFARFRVSTLGGLGPQGAAPDGEVEDVQLVVQPSLPGSGRFETPRTILGQFPADSVLTDLDADGDLDAIFLRPSSILGRGQLVWAENLDGGQRFEERTIASDWQFALALAAADLDGDGDTDVVAAESFENFVWFENQSDATSFVSHRITASDYNYRLGPADLDGDGDIDLALDSLYWLDNRDRGRTFVQQFRGAAPSYVPPADLDRNGVLDQVIRNGSWMQGAADGSGSVSYVQRDMGTEALFEGLLDAEGDGDQDVIGFDVASNSLVWIENQAAATTFVPHEVGPFLSSALRVVAADLDGDGDADLLTRLPFELGWYENSGAGRSVLPRFAPYRQLVGGLDELVQFTDVADLDGDGVLDLVVRTAPGLVWFRQIGLDLGDAPDRAAGTGSGDYRTRLADDGPRHALTGDVRLGATIGDADDGLSNPTRDLSLQFGQVPRVAIDVQTSTTPAMLAGWIDYDGDGAFEDNERALLTVPEFTVGQVTLELPPVPVGAARETFARFRLSSGPTGQLPGGLAADGEVEDYPVTIGTYVSFSLSPPVAAEDASQPATFVFERSGVVADELVLPLRVVASASFGSDFEVAGAASFGSDAASVRFAPGVTRVSIDVRASYDEEFEPDETVAIQLVSGATHVLEGPAELTATLRNVSRWQNPREAFDVDGSGDVTPLDAVFVIADLRLSGPRRLSKHTDGPATPFLDVSGDNLVTALDAIHVIQRLRAGASPEGEPHAIETSSDASLLVRIAGVPWEQACGSRASRVLDSNASSLAADIGARPGIRHFPQPFESSIAFADGNHIRCDCERHFGRRRRDTELDAELTILGHALTAGVASSIAVDTE